MGYDVEFHPLRTPESVQKRLRRFTKLVKERHDAAVTDAHVISSGARYHVLIVRLHADAEAAAQIATMKMIRHIGRPPQSNLGPGPLMPPAE